MLKIINTSRIFAAEKANKDVLSCFAPGPWAWIFIKEPIDGIKTPSDKDFVFNEYISGLPTLETKFWDITEPRKMHLLYDKEYDEITLETISDKDAAQIYHFLKTHSDKNIIVSCYAGISRSSAVAQFASKYLGYEWPETFRRRTYPNSLVYDKLVNIEKSKLEIE